MNIERIEKKSKEIAEILNGMSLEEIEQIIDVVQLTIRSEGVVSLA